MDAHRTASRRSGAIPATLVALAAVLVAALGLTACQPRLTLPALDRMVYETSLGRFQQWWTGEQAQLRRTSAATIERWLDTSPARFDDARSRSGPWDLSTDRCSASPDRGPGFDFRWPCIRHDLAWRNLKRLQRVQGGSVDTRARRVRATDRFLADLLATCEPKPYLQRTACRTLARAYHQAVLLVA